MNLDNLFKGMSISSTGMAAERKRLDVIAENIANANVVATKDGGAYRRKDVIFETILADSAGATEDTIGGVRVKSTDRDFETPMNVVHDPSHPMADKETGMVSYPNVNMAFEMVDLMTASRSYEANLKAISLYRDMMRQAVSLLEG